jgi:peptidoglycan/xylan/chitin deacetylase (PgdA/CDA1 family)
MYKDLIGNSFFNQYFSFYKKALFSVFATVVLTVFSSISNAEQIEKLKTDNTKSDLNSVATAMPISTPSSEHSFVILQYHHVGSETPRITSVSVQELEEHMAYLAKNHKVISLETALNAIENGTSFPERSVVITFDDGYKNILENGHPIFKKYGFEYTIFINPSQINVLNSQLTWDDVILMSEEGVTFANHTLDHLHLLDRYPNENDDEWLLRLEQNITSAEEQIQEKVGYSKKWLAYPFGEFDNSVKALLKSKGYLGFGQHSGAVGLFSDQQSIPRFPAAGRYANLDSLVTKINSLAMPVTAVSPNRQIMGIDEVIGEIQVDVLLDDIHFSRIACYFKGNSLPIKKTKSGFSFSIDEPFSPGRTRVNCTAPSIKESKRFYWYSMPFFTAKENGRYLD